MTATTVLRITARRPAGFRRAGLFHPATPVDHAIESITDQQLEALQAEPQLIVELVTLPNTSQPPAVPPAAVESATAAVGQVAAVELLPTSAGAVLPAQVSPEKAAASESAPAAAALQPSAVDPVKPKAPEKPAPKADAKKATAAAPKKGKGK